MLQSLLVFALRRNSFAPLYSFRSFYLQYGPVLSLYCRALFVASLERRNLSFSKVTWYCNIESLAPILFLGHCLIPAFDRVSLVVDQTSSISTHAFKNTIKVQWLQYLFLWWVSIGWGKQRANRVTGWIPILRQSSCRRAIAFARCETWGGGRLRNSARVRWLPASIRRPTRTRLMEYVINCHMLCMNIRFYEYYYLTVCVLSMKPLWIKCIEIKSLMNQIIWIVYYSRHY